MNLSDLRTVDAALSEIASRPQPWILIAARRFLARCVQGLTWRRVGVVVVFCAIYGAVLSHDPRNGGPPHSVATYLLGLAVALTYFLPVFLVVAVAANFAPKRLTPRAIVLGLVVVAGAIVGFYLMTIVLGAVAGYDVKPPTHARSPLGLLAIGWVGLAIVLLQERDAAAALATHEAAEHRLDLGRQMSEAQLQVLQSQIEPHFLFNSLAHVRRLYQTDPRAGRAMMRHLSRYLSAAQLALRETSIGLGHDLDLAVAYLGIQKIRMGLRLAFEIDVPDEAREARVPPMMITTLVENAIKHGLSPLPEGGMVRIVARLDGSALRIRVSDTGQGFQATLGTGVGLANIRARLGMLYGASGELSLHQNMPRGVTAAIVVPPRFGAVAEP
jgi:signal transduction histidine kinase